MPLWVIMMASIGMAFAFRYKIPALHTWIYAKTAVSKARVWGALRDLIECSFCVGFWSGLATWAIAWVATGQPMFGPGLFFIIVGGVEWALSVAAINYFFDALAEWLEGGSSHGPTY